LAQPINTIYRWRRASNSILGYPLGTAKIIITYGGPTYIPFFGLTAQVNLITTKLPAAIPTTLFDPNLKPSTVIITKWFRHSIPEKPLRV